MVDRIVFWPPEIGVYVIFVIDPAVKLFGPLYTEGEISPI